MFSVGDVCVLICVDNREAEYLVGEECVIVGWRADIGRYIIDHKNPKTGNNWRALPRHLRKKPPYDGNVKTSWDDLIVWKPRKTEKITYVGNEGVTYTVLYK